MFDEERNRSRAKRNLKIYMFDTYLGIKVTHKWAIKLNAYLGL